MAAKLAVDIGSQIFNPFLPLIAAGLGLSVVELGRLIGLRNVMGIFSPLSGALSDRFGYRLIIRVSLLLVAAGCLMLAASRAAWMVVLAIMLSGLGTSAFVPNLQAFVSSRLPYTLRARGLGMIEYSWALTGIVGLSLIGLLIAATDWRAPFYLLAAGMLAMSFIFGAMPGEPRQGAATRGATSGTTNGIPTVDTPVTTALAAPGHKRWTRRFLSIFVVGSNRRSTYAAMLAAALSFFAAMQMMITHGAWLAGTYGLDAAALGLVALILGCFDLAASVAVSLFTDRIGKKRSVLIGIGGSLVAYLVMPFLNTGVIQAVTILAAARMCFEFNIVSHFPLLSEQSPEQRGKVMTLGAATTMLGATLAGFTGPWLFVNAGVTALAWTSAAAVAAGMAIVALFVKER